MVRRGRPASREIRRVEILGAAARCFRETGYEGTRVDDIATRANLSKGAVYWHFQSKREVFLALFERYAESLAADRHAAREAHDARGELEQLGQVLLADAAQCDALLEHLARAPRDDALGAKVRALHTLLYEALLEPLERGVRSGEFAPHDRSAAARAAVALLLGLLLEQWLRPGLDLGAAWQTSVALLTHGLAAR